MPVSTKKHDDPPGLRAFVFHHLDLEVKGGHGIGDCPFCGREGKFSVDAQTSQWQCWSCQSAGNSLTFLRQWHEALRVASPVNPPSRPVERFRGQDGFRPALTNGMPYGAGAGPLRGDRFAAQVAADRGLLDPATVEAWGVVQAPDGAWLVPGYGTDGVLNQLYRRTRIKDGKGEWVWRLLPTPGVWEDGKAHHLHMAISSYDPTHSYITICEGPWDGMALWETDREPQGNIIAVPGANVWRDEWTEMCRGKHVTLMYDSDYPRPLAGGKVARAGYDGMQRVAWKLSGVAASVKYLKWGPEGYDPSRPDGWDVRDALTDGDNRQMNLTELLDKVEDVPSAWFSPTAPAHTSSRSISIEAQPCSTWMECEEAWKVAMRWREELGDALSVLLAVCASTKQSGNQLFLDLVGSPGSAKTTLCRGLLVSYHCIHLENASKLISGFKKPGDRTEKDCSFLARANNKTWVTCEFDVLASSHEYHQLMGKARRIFDGETSATYGNMDEDRVYTALRTPWIRAGTPKMMDHDQSHLGDRFLRFILTDPDEEEKRHIAKKALHSERAAMTTSANNTAGSLVDPETRLAHALTGGYVDWLRANVESLLPQVMMSEEAEDRCLDLAELSSDLRARPQVKHRHKEVQEPHECKELPTRLARQYTRLAGCLAVVLNRKEVDADILRIVRKVALDTAYGHSLKILQWLCAEHPTREGMSYQDCGGLSEEQLSMWTSMTEDRLLQYLAFLRRIDVLQHNVVRRHGMWALTGRVYELYHRIMRA